MHAHRAMTVGFATLLATALAGAVGAPGVLAAQPPAVQDESVSAVTQTTATLDASIDPGGQETTYRFEYGTTAAYGTVQPTPDASIGSGVEGVHAGQELQGLQPGSTYHYRVVATNASSPPGGTAGPDRTFTTPPAEPPLVSTGQAAGVAQNTATLTGQVDTRGFRSEYEFDIGTDTGYGTRIFGNAGSEPGPQAFAVTLQGLMPGTVYHYRVAATNTFGTSYGADVTFTTGVYPSAALAEPVTPALVPAILLVPEAPSSIASTANAASVNAVAHTTRNGKRAPNKKAGKRPGGHRGRRGGGSKRAGHAHGAGRGWGK
ncbi:MAG: hypothetical protein ACRDLF_10405 [Solirubrobacteraceae bacterium]